MEDNIKSLVIFTAGTIVGGLIAYTRLKGAFEARIMEQDQKSNEFWKKYYSEHQVVKPEEKKEEPEADIREDKIPVSLVTVPESKTKEVFAPVNTEAIAYDKYATQIPIKKEDIPAPICRDPYPITEVMWDDLAGKSYYVGYLHYYEEDDTYVSANDEPLTGDEALYPQYLGRVPLGWTQPGHYRVCNEKEHMIIDVTLYQTSYQKFMSGE